MRLLILLIMFNFSNNLLNGQFGISAEYLSFPLENFEKEIGTDFYDHAFGAQFNYWKRLKNYRVEFSPAIGYFTAAKANLEPSGTISMSAYQAKIRTNIYPLDIKNDCDCPTFSKQSGWFQKSIFLQIAPGYSFHQSKTVRTKTIKDQFHVLNLGLGFGFDIGLSDMITITPYVNYVIGHNLNKEFKAFEDFALKNKFGMQHYMAGINLGLRPDYARPSARRRRAIGF